MATRAKKLQQQRRSSIISESAEKIPRNLRDRPEFTTLMRTINRTKGGSVPDVKIPPSPSRKDSLKVIFERRNSTGEQQPPETRRDKIANSFTYESILHDHVVGLKALLIRREAASTAHDADAILKFVVERAEVRYTPPVSPCVCLSLCMIFVVVARRLSLFLSLTHPFYPSLSV